MSRRALKSEAEHRKRHASVFAALGDETRLSLVGKLSDGQPHSIHRLTTGLDLSRQAVTKHLRVLENVGIVHGIRSGRETLFALDPKAINETREYLSSVSQQWDDALRRLKRFLEQ
jgi:DNA-binding transcriptional ArsR family regulator